jgi:hypothetical protein
MLVLCFNHPISFYVIYPHGWHVTGQSSVSLSTGFAPWLVSQPGIANGAAGASPSRHSHHDHDARGAPPCEATRAPGPFPAQR